MVEVIYTHFRNLSFASRNAYVSIFWRSLSFWTQWRICEHKQEIVMLTLSDSSLKLRMTETSCNFSTCKTWILYRFVRAKIRIFSEEWRMKSEEFIKWYWRMFTVLRHRQWPYDTFPRYFRDNMPFGASLLSLHFCFLSYQKGEIVIHTKQKSAGTKAV